MDNEFKRLLNGANWAETGDRALPSDPTISPQIVRAEGLPIEYSETINLSRRRFNQILRELYGAAREVGLGISAYDAEVTYPAGSITQINGNLYYAIAQNSPSSPVNPATPGQTTWERIAGRRLAVKTIPDVIPVSDIFIKNDLASEFTIWWTPPGDGGSEITSTELRYSKTITFPAASTTTITYTQGQTIKVADANQFYISLRSINDINDNPSNWSPATLVRNDAILPGPVNTLQAINGTGSGTIKLNWAAAAPNGLTIQSYRVQWKSGTESFSTSTRTTVLGANIRTYDVTGLTNDTTYDFRVSAISTQSSTNTDGNVVSIAPINAPRVPGAPTVVTSGLSPDSAYIAISGGTLGVPERILQYEFQIALATDTSFTNNILTNNVLTSPFILVSSGLSAGTNYIVRARAYNGANDPNINNPNMRGTGGVGYSAWSSSVSLTTLSANRPDAPEIQLLRPKGNTLIGFVSKAIDENLSNITSYAYRYRATGSNTWLPSDSGETISGGLSGFERTQGILPGTTYQVEMRARNNVDWGDWSTTATSTFTVQKPPAPVVTITRPTSEFTTVTIHPSMNTGGAEITEYSVEYKLATDTNWTASSGHTLPYIVLTQINGTATYNVRVRARNSAGWGPYTNDNGATVSLTVGAPLKPTILIYRDTNRPRILKVIVTPNEDDVVPQTQYRYGWTVAGTTGWQYVTLTESTANLYLDANISWDIRAQAYNSAGEGTWSSSTAVSKSATIPPTAPTPSLDRINGTTLSYFIPNDRISDGGTNITNWLVQYKATDASNWSTTITSTVPGGSISGLDPTKTYQVQMKLRNAVGDSAAWSSSAQRGFTITAPGIPNATATRVEHKNIVVSVDKQDTGGVPITSFEAQYRVQGSAQAYKTVTSTNSALVIKDLDGANGYTINVRVQNSADWSQTRTLTSAATAARPATPTISATRDLSTGNATWFLTGNVDDMGSPITKYQPRWRVSSANSRIGGSEVTQAGGVLTRLEPGSPYKISVRARNAINWSDWSDEVEVSGGTTTKPAQPTIIAYKPKPQVIRVNFQQLNNTGNLTLTNYRVRYRQSDSSTWLPNDNGVEKTNESFDIETTGANINADYWVQGGVKNSIGWSDWSAVFEVDKTLEVPEKPTIQLLRRFNDTLIVSFDQIDFSDAGQQDITRYEARYRRTTETSNSDWHSSNVVSTSPITIRINDTDEHHNLSVQGRVRGYDDSYWSNWSTASTSTASTHEIPQLTLAQLTSVASQDRLAGGDTTGITRPNPTTKWWTIQSTWFDANARSQPYEYRIRGVHGLSIVDNKWNYVEGTSSHSAWVNPFNPPFARTDSDLIYTNNLSSIITGTYNYIQVQARLWYVKVGRGYTSPTDLYKSTPWQNMQFLKLLTSAGLDSGRQANYDTFPE